MNDRIVSVEEKEEDIFEKNIRPEYLDEYVGQYEIKENLRVFIKAAKMRNEPLDHVLLYGPPGLGKTTLAHIIANELGADLKTASGPSIEKTGDLAAILSNLEPGGEGKSKSIKINLPPFTLVGATTRAGDLSSPLRDRFGIVSKLEYYSFDELKDIVIRSGRVFDIKVTEDAAMELAKRSRKTPRVANRLFRRVRDFALVEGTGIIDLDITLKALKRLHVDDSGLDSVDREYLTSLIEKFNGGPVGVETISTSIGEEVTTIEDVVEPYLLQEGFIKRTNRGRIATQKAYNSLGFDYNIGLFKED